MVLFVNSCVRKNSRTLELARAVLDSVSDTVEEIRLYPDGPEGLDAKKLRLRDELLAEENYDHPMFRFARQFVSADAVVVAAPYWDLAFPAKMRAIPLHQYAYNSRFTAAKKQRQNASAFLHPYLTF